MSNRKVIPESDKSQTSSSLFSTSGFYGRRNPNTERMEKCLATTFTHLTQHPLPSQYNPGILGPPATWRVFTRQAEAIKFAQVQGGGVMVFSFEGEAVGSAGKRSYLVSHPSLMWYRQNERLPSQRCTYEVIQEGVVCKLYFDLEFLYAYNPHSNGVAMINTFIAVVSYFLHKEFDILCFRKSVLDLSSCTYVKFSHHLIYNIPNVSFATNADVGNFVHMICNKICSWAMEKEPLEIPDISLKDLQNLYVFDAKNTRSLFCDQSVYTKNRNFRMYMSTKYGKDSPLTVAKENCYVPGSCPGVSQEEQFFLDSLITLVNHSKNNAQNNDLGKIIRFGEGQQVNTAHSIPYGRSSAKTDMGGNNSSPYPEIDDFIRAIIGSGHIRCWHYFPQGERLIFEISGYRYCYNICREHKSNGIMYVVDLKTASYYQKCHDIDCHDFRSNAWPLPEKAVFWKYMAYDEMMEWIQMTSGDNMQEREEKQQAKEVEDYSHVILEDGYDDVLVKAAEDMEILDELHFPTVESMVASQHSSQASTQSLSQRSSNPWNRLSQISSPNSSFTELPPPWNRLSQESSQGSFIELITHKSELDNNCSQNHW